MTIYRSDLDLERDDATGGYNKYKNIFQNYTENELRQINSNGIPNTVPHVDMDAILAGREKRLTIEESRQKAIELCRKAMEELKGGMHDD